MPTVASGQDCQPTGRAMRSIAEWRAACERCGGRVVAGPRCVFDRPARQAVPSQAVPSQSDFSDQEEAQRQLDSERERQRAEQAAREEAARKKKEQEEFEKRQAAAVSSLKGASAPAASLKGTDPNVGGNSPIFGIKGLSREEGRSEVRALPQVAGQARTKAWEQLHCSASIAKYGLEAALKGDYQEQRYLFNEISKAMNGERTGVACEPAPTFPELRGQTPDLQAVTQAHARMIERAGTIAARMEQREASLPKETRDALRTAQAAPPAAHRPETDIERLRRIQREINVIIGTKIDGKTVEVIRQQEKDRTELVKTVLENEKVALDLGVDLTADTPGRRRRTEVPPPSSRQ